jgi:hypothetical protein
MVERAVLRGKRLAGAQHRDDRADQHLVTVMTECTHKLLLSLPKNFMLRNVYY